MGARKVPFSRELYIEHDDFREVPPKQFFRLSPGREVRLRYACYIKCTNIVKDPATGEVVEVHCTYDPESRGGTTPDGRKIKGTIHWVSARHAVRAEVRLYDRLFTHENPVDTADYRQHLNPDSLKTTSCLIEPSLQNALPGTHYQFERLGYFFVDTADSVPGKIVFNRTATLRDSWSKIEKKQAGQS
jgi:glutaminyl-tRNA synthetase